jgi:hydrogenase nickel incorporation protein HypA/HybF
MYLQGFSYHEYVDKADMHELRIAEDLVKIVLDTAGNEGLNEISTVNVCFGRMIQIVPEIFRFAFTVAVKNTIAAEARLDIEILPVELRCKNCGTVFRPCEIFFICEACGSADLEILQGKELYIKSIEGE